MRSDVDDTVFDADADWSQDVATAVTDSHVKCFRPYPLSLDGCLGFIWGSTTDLSSSMTKV